MKFDSQSAFPYPVLRSDSNDYVGEIFSATYEVSATNDLIIISVKFNLTCNEILEKIDMGFAVYGLLVTSNETFEQQFFESDVSFSEFKITYPQKQINKHQYYCISDIKCFNTKNRYDCDGND